MNSRYIEEAAKIVPNKQQLINIVSKRVRQLSAGSRPMVEVELADVVIRLMNYATHRGLDVPGAIIEKNRFNATRGHKHGGKRF
jgi:DNA-directed RNA polymerase subunit K/omega